MFGGYVWPKRCSDIYTHSPIASSLTNQCGIMYPELNQKITLISVWFIVGLPGPFLMIPLKSLEQTEVEHFEFECNRGPDGMWQQALIPPYY